MITPISAANRASIVANHTADSAGASTLVAAASSETSISDALAALTYLMAKSESTELSSAKVDAEHARQQGLEAIEKSHRAWDKERESRTSGPGLFSCLVKLVASVFKNVKELDVGALVTDVAKNVGTIVTSRAVWNDFCAIARCVDKIGAAVGSAALAGVTFGAASGAAVLVAVLLLSASSAVIGETKCLDGILGKGWSDRVALALGAASAAVSGGVSALSIASAGLQIGGGVVEQTQVFGDASRWIGLGLSLGGSGLQVTNSVTNISGLDGATNTAWVSQKTLRQMEVAANVVQAEGQTLEGASHVALARFDYNAEMAHSDAVAADARRTSAERLTKWILDGVEALAGNYQDARAIVYETAAMHEATGTLAANAMKG